MLLFWILMIVFVGIAVIVGVVKFKETKSMAADGKIINRKSMFWEDAELFTTTATYEQLKSAVKDGDFSSSSVDIYYDADGQKAILFKSNHAWNAKIELFGEQGDKNVFRLYFPAWKTQKYGTPYNINSMNAMVTSIEKILLSIDPATTVETSKMEVKTKTKFF